MITETYPAVVMSNEDDENRGRIKVACAGLLGDEEATVPIFVEPVHEWGFFQVPDVGEIIEVEVITGSPQDESFGQASIDNLDIKWKGKRYYTEGEDGNVEPTKVHNDFVATNYAKRRGFSTPFGHILMFDDTEGDTRMYISVMNEKLVQGEAPKLKKLTRIEVEPDGSFKITLLDKHVLHIQTKGNLIEVSLDEGKHIMRMSGDVPSFEVLLDSGASQTITGKDGDTTTVLGDGSVSAAIAEELESWLNDTYTPAVAKMHDEHFHALPDQIVPLIPLTTAPCIPGSTPWPPTLGIPIVPASLEDYSADITSMKLVFPAN